MKKQIALLLALLMFCSLTACGAKSEAATEAVSTQGAPMMEEAKEEPMAEEVYLEEGWAAPDAAAEPEELEEMAAAGESSTPAAPEKTMAEKIIYSANLSMETTTFDSAVASIESMIAEVGGYIQDSSVNGDTIYKEDGSTSIVNRYAYYNIAVPGEHFESFLNESGTIGNVTHLSRNAENVTSHYTDTEARLKSLRVQEERLMAMMEQTGDLESLIALEQRLSEVTYEIESYQRTLNNLDRRIAYSTVTIELWEVEIYTPTVPVTRTFSEKLSDAFSDGWKGFVRGGQNFVLFLAEALPTLVLLAVIGGGAALIIRMLRKRGAAKREARAAEKKARANQKAEAIWNDPPKES